MTCKTCYRSEPEIKMKLNAAGNASEQCTTCYDMIGKGAGYDDGMYSEKDINDWLAGKEDRKLGLEVKPEQTTIVDRLEAEKYLDKFNKQLIEVELKKIQPNLWNPNRHNEQSYQVLINSIKKFGFNDPVSVRQPIEGLDEYEIIDGEHRWRACKELGFTKVLVINFGQTTKEEAMTLTQLLNHKGKDDVLLKAKLLKQLRESQASLFDLLPESEKEKLETIKLLDFDFSQFDAQPGEAEEEKKDDIAKAIKKLLEAELIICKLQNCSSGKLCELFGELRKGIQSLKTYLK